MGRIYRETLPCGLELAAEVMTGVESASMCLLVPAGAAQEPAGQQGLAALLAEIICRGAGGLSAREHTDALERLGVQRETEVLGEHLRISATMLGKHLPEALPLLADMALRPNLARDSFAPAQSLALQAIDSLADDPQHLAMIELRARHYAPPLNRSVFGQPEDIGQLTNDRLKAFHHAAFVPEGSILTFAGQIDWPALRDQAAALCKDWHGKRGHPLCSAPAERGRHHVELPAQQTHIALATDAIPEPHPDSMVQRVAIAALSGGTASRLFTEVREKRSLCYAVHASYAAHRDRGTIFAYAGTMPDRAQETLDVTLTELDRLRQGVTKEELARVVVGMKSRLVMQGESTGARALAMAADQYLIGRPRSLHDVARAVDAVTLERLNAFLAAQAPSRYTVVTLGQTALEVPEGCIAHRRMPAEAAAQIGQGGPAA